MKRCRASKAREQSAFLEPEAFTRAARVLSADFLIEP